MATTTTKNEIARTSLNSFVATGDEHAFGAVVSAMGDLVYACAKNRVGDPGLAEEIAQTVFAILARKAPRIVDHVSLEGWLFTTTRLESAMALRKRKQERHTIEAFSDEVRSDVGQIVGEADIESWRDALPCLLTSMDRLGKRERETLLARYYIGSSYREIAEQSGSSEAACKMRVKRSLEKLKGWMSARGFTLSVGGIATGLGTHLTQAAPECLMRTLPADSLRISAELGKLKVFASSLPPIGRSVVAVAVSLMTLSAILVVARSRDATSSEQPGAMVKSPVVETAAEKPRELEPKMLAKPAVPRKERVEKDKKPDLEAQFDAALRAQVSMWQPVSSGLASEEDFLDYLRGWFLEESGGDLAGAATKAQEMLRYHTARIERLESAKARKPIVGVDRAMEYLQQSDPSEADYIILAIFSGSEEIFTEGASQFPQSPELDLAKLLDRDRYLKDPEAIEAYARKFPESVWPSLLATRRALANSDLESAAIQMAAISGKIFSEIEGDIEAAGIIFLTTEMGLTKDDATSHQMMRQLEHLRSSEFMMAFTRQIGEMFEEAKGAPSEELVELGRATIALTQAWHDTSSTPANRWDSAIEQRDLLQEIGPEIGKTILEEPYDEVLARTKRAAEVAREEIRLQP